MTSKRHLRNLTYMGLSAALLCVLSPISIPIGDVPLSLATLVILISAGILGPWKSAAAVAVYLILGCTGLPVFSGFTGGIGRILGPTGGFLAGYIVLAVIAGLGKGRAVPMIFGTLALYTVGASWYYLYTDVPWQTCVALCVFPYIPLDSLKIVAASIVTGKISKNRK